MLYSKHPVHVWCGCEHNVNKNIDSGQNLKNDLFVIL